MFRRAQRHSAKQVASRCFTITRPGVATVVTDTLSWNVKRCHMRGGVAEFHIVLNVPTWVPCPGTCTIFQAPNGSVSSQCLSVWVYHKRRLFNISLSMLEHASICTKPEHVFVLKATMLICQPLGPMRVSRDISHPNDSWRNRMR